MASVEPCRAVAARRAAATRAWRKLAPIILAAPLCLAAAASDRPGGVSADAAPIARARIERTVVSVDAAPCNRARLLRTASGAVYETEAAPQLRPGIRIRVSGTVYPQTSICKLYPWLRLDPDAPLPFGPPTALDVRLARSIPGALQQAAAQAVARAESGSLGIAALADLPQIEIVAAPAALRSLLDTLRQWSQWSHWSHWRPWRYSPGWPRNWSRQQLRAAPSESTQRQPGDTPADSSRTMDEDR